MKLSKVLSCGPRGKQNNRINISSGKSIFNPTLVREKEGGDYLYIVYGSSLVAQMITSPLAMQETQVQSLGQEDPQRKEWLSTPAFWPGEFHEQRSLAGYTLWGHKESDSTERLMLSLFR